MGADLPTREREALRTHGREPEGRFRPWTWNPEEFAAACDAMRLHSGVAEHVSRSKFPLHMLRYWICGRLLGAHLQGRTAPRVMEIGIDRGQFFHFCRALPQWVEGTRWHGADVSPSTRALVDQGYDGIHLADFTDANAVQALVDDPAHRGQYDAVVVIHFLEHLTEPEACLAQIRPLLKPDGVLVGGMPSCPEFAREARERHIRPRSTPFGHKSVFSVERLQQAFHGLGWSQQLITGAFFARSRDSSLEDGAGWLRFNLWFGATFPRWPGEVYFAASAQSLQAS
jgi:SAM-dependent methyltransferase